MMSRRLEFRMGSVLKATVNAGVKLLAVRVGLARRSYTLTSYLVHN